jgi:CSLREA domain-containing protein
MQQGLVVPTALASDDFDEDGVPDLVSGYVGPGGGIITLHQGNVDSIFPNSPEARRRKAEGTFTDAPFFAPARAFEIPAAPEFLGTGDFDADGHWDVVTAARGSDKLYWLPGDGQGSLKAARQVKLPGVVTTLTTGEINRRDGLTDVVVGISSSDGPEVLVFEWPEGALRGDPEVFALPAEATALALGQLDEDYPMDLAVAARSELLIVHGRDRRLPLDELRRAAVAPATIDQLSFPFSITSMVAGDFIKEQGYQLELALLAEDGVVHLLERTAEDGESKVEDSGWKQASAWDGLSGSLLVRAKVSSLPTDDLVVIDSTNHQLRILISDHEAWTADNTHSPIYPLAHSLDVTGEPVAVLPMRLNMDALSDLVILKEGQSEPTVALTAPLATFTVNCLSDDSDIAPGDGICNTSTIIEVPPPCNCTLRAAIEEANATVGSVTINFDIPGSGPHTIQPQLPFPDIIHPVLIDGTSQPGFSGTPVIELNGSLVAPGASGLKIAAGSSVVRGLAINGFVTANFVIRFGINLTTNGDNIIEGNFIGTDITGTMAKKNSFGVFIDGSSNNTIGGTTDAARNLISGNANGVTISGSNGNQVQGNYIGTDVFGSEALGNTLIGVSTPISINNTIGGTGAGARNVISGNGSTLPGFPAPFHGGVLISGEDVLGNLVQGNFIGIDATGRAALGNIPFGVIIDTAFNNTVGGTTNAASNVISANTLAGVMLFSDATGNRIQGNSIFSNGGLGIDLNNDGVTLNDVGDGDAGPNNLQNFPVLSEVSTSGGSTTIRGSLNSRPNTTFTLEFFTNSAKDPSDFGEGESFFESRAVTTDSSGNFNFTFTISKTAPAGHQFMTAMATDPAGNTSEFAQNAPISPSGTLPPSITVVVPNGGENWPVDSAQTIQWTSSGVSGNVKIELSRDGGSTFETLFASTANDGSQSWMVTEPATTQALVRVSSVNNPSVSDLSNAEFTISQSSAFITVAVPNGGENWQINTSQTIRWTSSGITGSVNIELSRDGGATFVTLFANTPNDGSESWTVTGLASSNCLVKISSVDDPSISDLSDAAFTISNPPGASITVLVPNGGESWRIGTVQTIRWTSNGVTGNVNIELSRDGGFRYTTLIARNVANTGSYQWTVTGPASSQCKVRVISLTPVVLDESDTVFSITP